MEKDKIVYKITVADLQEEVGGRMGRELTDEEILYLEKEMPNCISYGRSVFHALLWKDAKIDENSISRLLERMKKPKP